MPDDWSSRLYEELRELARRQFRGERPGHTLQPTALVNEVWLRMRDRGDDWVSRGQFFLSAAMAMRRILIEYARRRGRVVHGGGIRRVTLGTEDLQVEVDLLDLLGLYEAIDRLEAEHARAAKVVLLRYMVGRTTDEIAELLGISAPTVRRDLDFGRRFLRDMLRDDADDEPYRTGDA